MAEEEVLAELEALEAVYGDDCVILEKYPPCFHLHLKPRTADISSQQFVEATISISTGHQYPEEPPRITMVDSKGLDEQRQNRLISCILDKASELLSCLMLVALCEEAVERISSMNQPDGDCPLCLLQLVDDDSDHDSSPFMKLMSCFHCFHRECIVRWWSWLQKQRGRPEESEERVGNCPVCRKVFHAKDIEHVLGLVETLSDLDSTTVDGSDEASILHSDLEKVRKEKFEAVLKVQQEKGGLIEPKQHEVLMPGMYLPRPTAVSSTTESLEQHQKEPDVGTATNAGSSSSRDSTNAQKDVNLRKHRRNDYRKQVKHWVKKENSSRN